MGFTEFYWVLLGFTEFLEVSLGGRDIKRQRLAVDASFVGKNGFFFQLSIFFWLGTDRLWLERDGRRLSTVANGAVAFDAVAKLAPALVLLRRRPRTRGLCRDSFFSPSCTEFYRVLPSFAEFYGRFLQPADKKKRGGNPGNLVHQNIIPLCRYHVLEKKRNLMKKNTYFRASKCW